MQLFATAQEKPDIYGYTDDDGRSFNNPIAGEISALEYSTGNINTAGILVTPTDLAPEEEPGQPGVVLATKKALGQDAPVLRQGDGSTTNSPDPVEMLRLSMAVRPAAASQLSGVWQGLIVQTYGTPTKLKDERIDELALYYDADLGGGDGQFDPTKDVLIATAAYDISSAKWYFGSAVPGALVPPGVDTPFDQNNPSASTVTTNAKNFFLTVRLAASGYGDDELPTSLGLGIYDTSSVLLKLPKTVGVASNNFDIRTATSAVQRKAADIYVGFENVAAWWAPPDGGGLPTASYNYVDQAAERVGMMKLQMWTNEFTGTIGQLTINRVGNGLDTDIKSVRLFVDSASDGDVSGANGTFEKAIDTEITDFANPVSFVNGKATLVLDVNNAPFNAKHRGVETTTRTYFVVYDFAPGANPGLEHGAKIVSGDIRSLAGNGNIVSFLPLVTSTVSVRATSDFVTMDQVNGDGCTNIATGCPPASSTGPVVDILTQGQTFAPVAKYTLKTDEGSALWSGLMLDRWMHSSLQGGAVVLENTANDVKDIRVYRDKDGDGLFTPPPADELVTSFGNIHNFPSSKLAVAISSTAPSPIDVYVESMAAFFPDDDVFPQVPQRLVLGDDQTDENQKEVMICDDIDVANKVWLNCERAEGGTQQGTFSTGTVLSGPARLKITGQGGGQIIEPGGADFFVVYDLNALATVGPSTNLGTMLLTTDYLRVQAPKQVNTTNIGLSGAPDFGQTVRFITRVEEYPDNIVVLASNTVETDAFDQEVETFLQQQSTAVVLTFAMATDQADAYWRWVLVQATGTSADAGAQINDVQRVSLWLDVDGNGKLLENFDIELGTGSFNNAGSPSPLMARINLKAPHRLFTSNYAAQHNISQNFMIAYYVSANAETNEPPPNPEPRTLGATLMAASFPIGNLAIDDAAANSFNLAQPNKPNKLADSSPLPFIGKQRKIIPSPQTMTVDIIPMFATSTGAFESPRLVQDVSAVPVGTVDASWLITSTAGLPNGGATTYITVDEEIVSYDTLGDVGGLPALIGVVRGRLGTSPQAHEDTTVMAPNVRQGEINFPIAKIKAWSSNFQVQWESLRMQMAVPPGLKVEDDDIAIVRLWRSSTTAFERSGPEDYKTNILADVPLASGTVQNGVISLSITDPQLADAPYTLVSKATQTFYVSVSIDPAAQFSHEELPVDPNETLGRWSPQVTDFGLSPKRANHSLAFTPSVTRTPAYPIIPTINTMEVLMSGASPNSARQNQQFVPMVKLTAKTDQNTVRWERLAVDRAFWASSSTTRGAIDTDITLLRVFRDSDGDGAFTSVDYATDTQGNFPHMLSLGNESYEDHSKEIIFKVPEVVTTEAQDYFVTYDFSQFAGINSLHGLSVDVSTKYTVQVPHTVISSPTAGYTTNPLVRITEVPSNVTLGVNDVIFNGQLANGSDKIEGVSQAQAGVSFLRFNLTTDLGTAVWEDMRLERGGGSQDPSKLFGRNTNVSFVKFWKDINQNDVLDADDVNISEIESVLMVAVSSETAPPFALVLASTRSSDGARFPPSGQGRILIGGAELMSFSGYGETLIGGTTYPTLSVISRADRMGDGPTPNLTHAVGAEARKVDVFNQEDDQNLQILVELAATQTLSPTAAVFFVSYDIGATAVKNDQVSVNIRDKSWVGVSNPNDTLSTVRVKVSKEFQTGSSVGGYPYIGTKVFITPLTLTLTSRNIAPAAVTGGQSNVALEQIRMNTSSDFVRVAQVRLTQLGTVQAPPFVNAGKGDASEVAIWLDDGNGAFTPATDTELGRLVHNGLLGGSAQFDNGMALIDLAQGGVPYLTVSTVPLTVFITAHIASQDVSLGSTIGHTIGFSLEKFKDLIGPNSADITAISDDANQDHIPARSGVVTISTAVIALSNSPLPIMMDESGYPAFAMVKYTYETKLAGPCAAPDGTAKTLTVDDATAFPIAGAYKVRVGDEIMNVTRTGAATFQTVADASCAQLVGRECDNEDGTKPGAAHEAGEYVLGGGAVKPQTVMRDANDRPIPDRSKWIKGQPMATSMAAVFDGGSFEPLIDINGDGEPDNMDFLGTGLRQQISLIGTKVPSIDMDGDGLLDIDINGDGRPDLVQDDGQGNLVYFIINKEGKPEPLSDQGLALAAWSADNSQLEMSWPMPSSTQSLTGYEVAIGESFDNRTNLKNWFYVGTKTTGTLSALNLPVANVTHLKSSMTATSQEIFVEETFFERGLLIVGSELIGARRVGDHYVVDPTIAGCPSGSGRGCGGSLPQVHLENEVVSSDMVLVSVRGFTGPRASPTGYVPSPTGRPILAYRIDDTPPSEPPTSLRSSVAKGDAKTTFTLSWSEAVDSQSGIKLYHIQERSNVDPVWKTIGMIPAKLSGTKGERLNTKYTVGSAAQNPTEKPRATGQFLTYRVRAYSSAGTPSGWSTESAAVATSITSEVIDKVSNYPNPFDSRKGGPEGQTVIVYTLGTASDVEIVIYDLLGYVVKSFHFTPGENGGRQGANYVIWDGHNGMGRPVAKGGYIARIKVGSSLGTATIIRKIGVIH
ncbi:MAG: hypothetical protein ABIJ96_07505 [Elusimicrobiota bacterium]